MPKTAKTDAQWRKDMFEFALSGKKEWSRGYHPRCDKWKREYKNILACPKHLKTRSVKHFFGGRGGAPPPSMECKCTYHPGYLPPSARAPVAVPAPAPAPARSPGSRIVPGASLTRRISEPLVIEPKVYSIGNYLPKVPPRPLGMEDVKNKIGWMPKSKNKLDLFVFGPMTGSCPYCGTKEIRAHDVTTRLKPVWTSGIPYYAVGVDISCLNLGCKRSIKSIDQKYVRTLPRKDRLAIPFLQTGHTTGIDYKLIRMMRIGALAENVAQSAQASLQVEYEQLKSTYISSASRAVAMSTYDTYAPFEDLPDTWKVKKRQLVQAFLCDFYVHKHDLLRELQTIKSEQTLAADHQRQVVKRVKQGHMKEDEIGTQSFIVNGDYGLVLNYVVVPSTGDQWTDDCLDEVVVRHGDKCPKILFVDCNCCNGLLGDTDHTPAVPGEDGYRLWKSKLTKKLDGLHVCMRVSRSVNPAHPRLGLLSTHIAKAIYVRDNSIEEELERIREENNLNLNEQQKKNDWRKYGRQCPGASLDVATRIMDVVETHRQLDHEALLAALESGEDMEDMGPEHPAYPIMTKKTHKACVQQAIHALNGCMDCHGEIAHSILTHQHYRNTNVLMPIYRSHFGSSRCETFHSVQARMFANCNNLREAYFDARSLWKVTHFNRNKLRALGRLDIPLHGVAPVEYANTKLHTMDLPPLFFGFDYCRRVQAIADDKYYEDALVTLDEFGKELDDDKDDTFDELDDMFQPDAVKNIGDIIDEDDDSSMKKKYTPKWSKRPAGKDGIAEVIRKEMMVARASPSPAIVQNRLSRHPPLPKPAAYDLTEDAVAHQVATRQNALKSVSPRRDVYRRRGTRGDLTYYAPNANKEMEEVWFELFAKANATERTCDGQIIDELLSQYTMIELTEKAKGDEARPLLPVSRAKAAIWIKKTHLSRNRATKEGRTSGHAVALTEGLQNRLSNRPMNPVVNSKATEGTSATAAIVPDKVPNNRHQHKKAHKRCRTCGVQLGSGEGMHKRGACPKMTEEDKAVRDEQKKKRDDDKDCYDRDKAQRIVIARHNIKNNLKPELARTKMRKGRGTDLPAECSYCPICSFDYNKGLPPSDPNWHFTKRKRMLYCPWADPQSVKDEIVKGKQEARETYNSKRRNVRSASPALRTSASDSS